MKNGSFKTLAVVFVLAYILSPVDACPGAFDDIIIAVVAILVYRRLTTR